MDPEQLNAYIEAAIMANPQRRAELEALRGGMWGGGDIPDAANLIPGLRDSLAGQRNAWIQPRLEQYTNERTAQGLRTDATDANTLASDDWRNWNAGQPMGGGGAPTASPAMPSGGGSQWTEGVPQQWNERFSFDPSKISENPSYQFKVSELTKGVNRGAAARGLSFTNAARQELGDRLNGLASTELDAEYGRQAGAFDRNFGTFDSNRNFAANRADTGWNQARTDVNDQWGRGSDLWSMNRTDRQDQFDNNYRLSDLVLARRPRPA